MLHKPEPLGWTERRETLLRKFWAEGMSANEIAIELGGGLTRNAVIGKVHRLKLPKRHAVTPKTHATPKPHGNKGQPKANAIVQRVAAKKAQAPKVEVLPVSDDLPDVTSRIGLEQMTEAKTCRWINGDPLAEHSFCPNPRKEGSSWCEQHHRRVYPARVVLA